jgi:hypothetical protein
VSVGPVESWTVAPQADAGPAFVRGGLGMTANLRTEREQAKAVSEKSWRMVLEQVKSVLEDPAGGKGSS